MLRIHGNIQISAVNSYMVKFTACDATYLNIRNTVIKVYSTYIY